MKRSTPDRPRRGAKLACVLVLLASVLTAGAAPLPASRLLKIEPASTRVGIARVYLEIEDLRQANGLLEGTYRIRVPLAPSQNDIGRIRLQTAEPIDQLIDGAVTVLGNALSSSGKVHDVVAHIQPDGVVHIDVTTTTRTLHFKSRYVPQRG